MFDTSPAVASWLNAQRASVFIALFVINNDKNFTIRIEPWQSEMLQYLILFILSKESS